MDNNIKVYIEHQEYSGETLIYIVSETHDGIRRIVEPIDMVFRELIEGQTTEPTLRLGLGYSKPFMQAFAELQNELTAVKYHLEDMRKLVFKNEGKPPTYGGG